MAERYTRFLVAAIVIGVALVIRFYHPDYYGNLSPQTITAHIPNSIRISPFAHPSSNVQLMAGDKAVTATDYPLAMSLYEQALPADRVSRGQAETRIAYLYLYGMGRPRDPVAALSHLKAAAELGDPLGEANLAYLYAQDPGVPHDYSQARHWAAASAVQGVTWSMNWIGWSYLGAYGVKRDLDEARQWYQKSADLDDSLGEAQLAWFNLQGWGGARNVDLAMDLYRRSAIQGNPLGEEQLGWMYVHVRHQYTEGMKWYLKAADQRYALAENNIGFLYENGLGVPQDFAAAARWYERAASDGSIRSQYHLATLYARGLGVPKDLEKGRALARSAAARGDAQALMWLITHAFAAR